MNLGAGENEGRNPSGLSRPINFRRQISGRLYQAWQGSAFGQPIARPRQQAKKAGISFEKKVCAQLSLTYPERFISQICFKFVDSSIWNPGRSQTCYVDGLLFSADWKSVTLIEIKLRHSADAFHQLWNFYRPIVQKAWPCLQVNCLEICRWYDPAVKLPKPVAFVEAVHQAGGVREAFHPLYIQGLT